MFEKTETVKRNWVMKAKQNKEDDHIIFRNDEEIHGDIRFDLLDELQTTNANFGQSMPGRRGNNARVDIRERMTDRDWEQRFNQLMSLHLIDVPDNYYKDDLQFNDPNQLKTIFNDLEVLNLKMINQMQENELGYETLVNKEQELKRRMDKKYVTQNANRVKLQNNINESKY